MFLENSLELLRLISAIGIINAAFCTLLFTRTSMKYIERKLLKEGIDIPSWDQKGWGLRVSTFITLVARGKPSNQQVLADDMILKHVRLYDKYLAIIICASFILGIIPGVFLTFFIENAWQ